MQIGVGVGVGMGARVHKLVLKPEQSDLQDKVPPVKPRERQF
jgi:hypothetical protein